MKRPNVSLVRDIEDRENGVEHVFQYAQDLPELINNHQKIQETKNPKQDKFKAPHPHTL